jgi:hypothetical protein
MWISEVTGLIGREASPKFFVRVVWPVMLLDQIEDQLIGLFAHLRPLFAFPLWLGWCQSGKTWENQMRRFTYANGPAPLPTKATVTSL